MLICHCKRVNDRAIQEAALGGACTVGQIRRRSGAGSCCGGCVPAIVEVLENVRQLPVEGAVAVAAE